MAQDSVDSAVVDSAVVLPTGAGRMEVGKQLELGDILAEEGQDLIRDRVPDRI